MVNPSSNTRAAFPKQKLFKDLIVCLTTILQFQISHRQVLFQDILRVNIIVNAYLHFIIIDVTVLRNLTVALVALVQVNRI
jgi:hypothetical protein